MTDNSPKATSKLVPAARSAYQAMFWPGLSLGFIAAIVVVIGFANDDEYARAGALAFAGGTLQLALILLVGAGIVSGLGRRVRDSEPSDAEQRGTE